jgi:hypothetical protein
MKKIISFVIMLTILTSCSKKEDKISTDCYLVGYQPCTHAYEHKGYVLISSNLQDTLLTYNFPDSIFKIPPEYFENYVTTGYFPDEARYSFKTKYYCRVATRAELIYPGCFANINTSEFTHAKQVITLSATIYKN